MTVCFNNFKAQTPRFNNCEGYNMNQFGPGNTGSIGIGSSGANAAPQLTFAYQTAPLANPAATPKSSSTVLQVNTNATASGKSVVFFSGAIDFTRNCVNSPMTVSFWMYRTGTDASADRVRLLINTSASLTGATLLLVVNRSRALSPTVYGIDGWYRYEAAIPPAFNSNGYLMFDAIDASAGATGNIFIDDIQYHDNNFWSGNVTGGVADAGPDITICNGGKKEIGCTATANTTYAWAPAGGLSATNISNPLASPAASTNYTVTTTTTGGGCTTVATDVVTVTVLASAAPVMSSATSTNVCSGNTLAFPFAATNSPTGYIWLASNNAVATGESFVNTINSATLNDVITSASAQVVTYSVSAYNVNCPAGTNPIQSFSVNVGLPPTLFLSGINPACNGGMGSITAAGANISTYLWNTGATTSMINVVAGAYSCTVTSACGATVSASYVLVQPTVLGSFTSGAGSICSGATANVTINGSGATPPYVFNWIATSNTNVTGESLTTQTGNTINNTLVNTSAANQSVSYSYSVTDANGCIATGTKVISVTNTVLTTAGPSNTTVCQTNTATFATTAVGGSGSFSYQWQEDNGGSFANISNGGVYSGATVSTLTITSPPPSMNTYRYRCIMNDGCTTFTSSTGILNVIAAFSHISSYTDQPVLTNVGKCASKQEILRLTINMSTGSCPSTPSVTSIDFTAAGTEAEISKAYIYYTGSNPNFVPTTLFATIPTVGPGNINVTGSQALITGTNYFWIVYDINQAGPGVSNVDASLSNYTLVGGSNPSIVAIAPANPIGSRAISTCISPGGVIAGLTYWLKSNDGSNLNSSTHDAPINTWSSSFSNISDLTQATSTKRPIFKDYPNDTTFNFNPYLAFDGNDDILQNTSITDLLNDDGLALVVCARSVSVAPNNRTAFGFQSADDGAISYQIMPEKELRYRNSALTNVSFDVSGFTDPDTDFIMAKMLSIVGNSSGSPDFADFRRNDDVFQSSGTIAPDLETGFTIGGSGDGASYNRSNSKIAEVITFNEYLSKADLDKVETYAAIKYGIHLNKDYVSSGGSTVWDYAADVTYNHDIAGIGRDDKSGLNQKQTQSVNIDEMLTIGLDSIESSNKNNTAVFSNDNSFLVWGNNDQPPHSDYTTTIPLAAPFLPVGVEGRLRRVWKLQGTNFGTAGTFKSGNPADNQQNGTMGGTTIEVAFDDYLLTGTFPVANLVLLVDDDGADFSNAIIKGPGKTKGGATQSGARIFFQGIGVGTGQNYVTLATTDIAATLLPIELINFNVVCENKMANVSWKTSSETNVKEYVIEQSIDGINYTLSKIISPKGTNNSGANYSVLCNLIPSKINYFRLKETSNSNVSHNYKPISLSENCIDAELSAEAFMSPNPISKSKEDITIRFNKEINSSSDLKIINSLGNTIYETEYKSTDTYNSLKLHVKNLELGIYFLEVKNKTGNYQFKFIVVD